MDKAVEAALDAWFGSPAWRSSGFQPHKDRRCKDMTAAITAADAARAVTDAEIDKALTGVKGGIIAQIMRENLHTAGFKVIRG